MSDLIVVPSSQGYADAVERLHQLLAELAAAAAAD
jgi:hypothetical protein